MAQRRSPELFGDALQSWLRGGDDVASEAAGQNVAELLVLLGNSVTDNKWGGG